MAHNKLTFTQEVSKPMLGERSCLPGPQWQPRSYAGAGCQWKRLHREGSGVGSASLEQPRSKKTSPPRKVLLEESETGAAATGNATVGSWWETSFARGRLTTWTGSAGGRRWKYTGAIKTWKLQHQTNHWSTLVSHVGGRIILRPLCDPKTKQCWWQQSSAAFELFYEPYKTAALEHWDAMI